MTVTEHFDTYACPACWDGTPDNLRVVGVSDIPKLPPFCHDHKRPLRMLYVLQTSVVIECGESETT